MMASFFIEAASCSGVLPSSAWMLTLAPLSTSIRTMSTV